MKKILLLAILGGVFFAGCLTDSTEDVDIVKPELTVLGKNPDTIAVGASFVDSGAIAIDNIDGDITSLIVSTGEVDTSKSGSYSIVYTISDLAGNITSLSRVVIVLDAEKPVITIKGRENDTIVIGDSYHDSGATAFDVVDGDLTSRIISTSNLDTSVVGTYTITYIVSDLSENSDTAIRTIIVEEPSKELFIFETDFSTGGVSKIDGKGQYSSLLSVYDDASIYSYKGSIYILEQYGADNIVKLNSTYTGIEYQKHLIDNANPHDIAFINDNKAYVACNKYSQLLIVNPVDGSIVDSIDIGAFAYKETDTTNTIPNAEDIILKDGFAYVSLQRRDGFSAVGKTWILKINTINDSIVDTLKCSYPNGGKMILVDNSLYIPNKGGYQDITDGGIEKIDLLSGTISILTSEASLGWNITGLTLIDGNRAVASCVNYDASWNKTLLSAVLDLSTGLIVDTLDQVTEIGSAIFDAEKSRLFVAERDNSRTPGVCMWRNGVYIGKIETDIAPNRFVFLED